jgi:predicted ATP-dependent endonuclease of OLD family
LAAIYGGEPFLCLVCGMIKRIELTNFMSHEHTVIEPAAGLTVLIGPNNCGKSAIVAALQILASNENSTYVMRHGAKECSVKVETDELLDRRPEVRSASRQRITGRASRCLATATD